MDDQQVGALLRDWRLRHEHSMRSLGREAGIHFSYLSHFEAGRKRLPREHAERLDSVLGTDGALTNAVTRLTEYVPEQLPPVENLVDRVELITEIRSYLAADQNGQGTRTVVLTGPGGIGKTAVASAAALQLRAHYQGIVWADLRGWDEATGPRSPAQVLRTWCAATGMPMTDLPAELDDLMILWRDIMAHRRLIIGVDNARSEQIPALIPGSPGSVVLITSRDRAPSVPGAVRWMPVPLLESKDATTLVARRSGQPARRVERLVARGGGFPLALRSLGDYVAAHANSGDEEMIEDMSADTAPPDAVKRAAELSYQGLTTDQARAWRLCAVLPDITPETAAAATRLSAEEARTLLNAVADASLLSKHGRGWRYHELHRAYALEESQRVDDKATRDDAAERSFLFMLHGWANAGVMLAPDRRLGPGLDPPPPGVRPPHFDSYESALQWSETHWEYLPVAVNRAITRGWIRMAWQLMASSFSYVILVKAWSRAYELAQIVADVTERSDTVEGLAWMSQILGYIDVETGNTERALVHLTRSLELRRRRGDERDIGWAAQSLARAHLLRNEPKAATNLLGEAIDALEGIGATSAAASARSLRGTLCLFTADIEQADTDLTRAVEQLPVGGDPLLHCYAYTRLANARLSQNHPDDAEELARHAVDYAHEHSALFSEVDGLEALGQIQRATDDIDNARASWNRALEIADYLGGNAATEAERIQEQLDELPRP